ncbi:DUF3981 domain-containing protein [Bacillus mexicanus]|uniref:DUF3981 domain-containing protein n=1 Tax=Bacillus mexicanus TaxID=2834415 RepID=UPI003D1F04CF
MKFIVLLILSLLMLPLSKKSYVSERSDGFTFKIFSLVPIIVFWILTGIIEYFFLLDNNISGVLVGYALLSAIFIVISLYFAEGESRTIKIGKLTASLLLFLSFVYFGFINDMVVAEKKYESVNSETKEISEPFTEKDTPFSVPPKTAKNKMKKVFGDIPKVSYYELGELTPQNINGELVYVAPIEISGYFKARKAEYSPGYVTMSGTDPDAEAKLHLKHKMKYIPSMYFGDNLDRVIRNAEPNLIFKGDEKLEVDDEGKPFYTRTYGDFVSGRSGFVPKGVVVVDPENGDVKKYEMKDAPKFLDATINYETAGYLNDTFGTLIHGIWNSWFSKTDVKLPTDWGTKEGVTPIFDKNGKMLFFSDFTSPKEGVDSALGYSLVDAETGKLTYYDGDKVKGIMDGSAAQEVVDNTFKKEKWKGTMPVLYNIYGEATWMVPVVDDGGLVRSYSLIAASNAKTFASGNTQKEAFKKYKNALSRKSGAGKASSTGKNMKVEGQVVRTYKESTDDGIVVYLLLKNNDQIFMVSSADFPYALFTEVGDKVKVEYKDTGDLNMSVSDFSNNNFKK